MAPAAMLYAPLTGRDNGPGPCSIHYGSDVASHSESVLLTSSRECCTVFDKDALDRVDTATRTQSSSASFSYFVTFPKRKNFASEVAGPRRLAVTQGMRTANFMGGAGLRLECVWQRPLSEQTRGF